jgi:CheY-like chemotaxis protein
MDEATMKKIFDPFFTTREMKRGTGLGLASAYGIIKNHEGLIDVSSEMGRGTTFNIYLPASDKRVARETTVDAPLLTGDETVLLVDDEKMIIEVGEQMLEKLGYRVMVAQSGRQAVDLFREHHDQIQLVILDMIMPEMSGGETFDRLREIQGGAKVLLSSGYSMDAQAQAILNRGCEGFIQKPFKMADLSRQIRQILDNGSG